MVHRLSIGAPNYALKRLLLNGISKILDDHFLQFQVELVVFEFVAKDHDGVALFCVEFYLRSLRFKS